MIVTDRLWGVLILIMCFGNIACSSNPKDSSKTPQKNVLFIIVDDLRPELACYGQSHIKSPNIDKLASHGILFQRAYVQQAICAASRASFLAGCRPETIGVDYPYSEYYVNDWLKKHDDISTWFFNHGYYTANIGKVHHTYPGWPIDSLSRPMYVPGGKRYALDKNRIPVEKKYFIDKEEKNTLAYEFVDAPDTTYKDGKITQEAVKVLNEIACDNKPFFMALGYLKPHLPFVAPKRYWDMYPTDSIKLSSFNYIPEGSPSYARGTVVGEMNTHQIYSPEGGEYMLDKYDVNEKYALNLRRAYYACVSFIDDQVGIVVKELERLGLAENTIIVFVGDHGWHLGDNGCWGKITNFESATRAPFIIYDPSSKTHGIKSNALTEFVDIYPTLTDLAGIETPDFVEGISLRPLLENTQDSWKKAAFSRYPRSVGDKKLMGYSIRTNKYRYTEWRNENQNNAIDSLELYLYEPNMLETRNLAYDEEYFSVKIDLAQQLKNSWKAALPSGITNESNNPKAPAGPGWGREVEVKEMKRAGL